LYEHINTKFEKKIKENEENKSSLYQMF
jgi:hypothetical protein